MSILDDENKLIEGVIAHSTMLAEIQDICKSIIENELGNTDRVQELKDELKEQEVELTEKMNNYLDGKITATEMFTEGTGDVQ